MALTDKIVDFFPDKLPAKVSDNLKAMTVRDLLTMSCGHDVEPSARNANAEQDWVTAFLAHPVVHEPGDVNHDGAVNIKDVTDLIDYLLGSNNEVCEVCANVKDDGAINIADVTALIDLLLRIQTTE